MSELHVGDKVMINGIEGFGGPGVVVAERPVGGSHFKVRLDDGSQPDFWAHDFEVVTAEPAKEGYDSRPATREHIDTVRVFLGKVVDDLMRRRQEHDASKLVSPEVEAFDEWTPKLKATTYGSEEYKGSLEAMKPALVHHYAHNSHHPEHYPDGVRGMSLLDVVEMLCDWKAATLRHADGDIRKSVEINQKRFGYSDELKQILLNTLPLLEG
jgi:hypothetical protein